MSTNMLLDRKHEDTECREFLEAFEYSINPIGDGKNLRFGVLSLFLPDRKLKRSAKKVKAYAEKLVDEGLASRADAKNSLSSRHVFLDDLSSATHDRNVIRDELLNILLAGRDTTTSMLSNLLWELPKHPDIVARLRREITQDVGDEAPTYDQLKSMTYLQAIMKETQRLYPTVPANSREANKDTVLPRGGGPDGSAPVLVRKGSLFLPHVYTMHRRADIYGDDALAFDPTRWLDGEHASAPLRPGWAYGPFSGGPRVCIGQNLALTEVAFVVVRLLQAFDMESRDAEPWVEKLSLTALGLNGCKVALTARR